MLLVRSDNPIERSATAVDITLIGVLDDLADILQVGLTDMVGWGYRSAALDLVRSIPEEVWMRRIATPRNKRAMEGIHIVERAIGVPTAMEVVDLEFGTPTVGFVQKMLSGVNGVNPMSRIKTVAAGDLFELRRHLVLGFSATNLDDSQASAVNATSAKIRQLVGNDPGKSTGMNYRAKRIARTEGIRIAEASQRAAWRNSEDMFAGIRTMRGGHKECEICNPYDNKMFWKTEDGQYIADDGEHLPDFPAHPNCLCYTLPELADDLTADLPPADMGDWYAASQARAAGELANVVG